MTVTRDGAPGVVLSTIPMPRLSAEALVARWRNVPVIDGGALRDDIAGHFDGIEGLEVHSVECG